MIKEKEYRCRRKKLLKKLSNNSIAILYSSEQKIRSNDTEYPYRQDSNFYYLTGFKEDNSILVLLKTRKSTKTILFVQKKDKVLELWTGKRVGEKKAKKRFLFDEIYTSDKLEEKLKEFIQDINSCYFDFLSQDIRVEQLKKETKKFRTYKDISYLVKKMRQIKSKSEIKLIKKAIQITKKAHHKVMKLNKKNKNEYELQANIEHTFKNNGAYSDAYTSIVASGNSANTLHYIRNDKSLKDKELILIDAGCEYDYYASDITRTIPVSGRFTSVQKELYKLVLNTQLEIIKMIKPNIKRSKLQKKSQELLCKGMLKLGILKGSYKKAMKKEKFKRYYPHGIGHWMGIDVHDPSPYKNKKNKEILLQKGMVLTVEPGIYIEKNDKNVPKKYRGIGIRVEDNILVTKNGYKNLSLNIAKTIKEIENI